MGKLAAGLALCLWSLATGAALPGPFREEAPVEVEAKAGETCSLFARYDPDFVVGQEIHFLGGLLPCGDFSGWYAAASAAALGLPPWQSYGFAKVGAPPGPTTVETPYQCAVNVNFEPATPTKVQVMFTGAAACTVQRGRILAVLKGAMRCNVEVAPCPWSNP